MANTSTRRRPRRQFDDDFKGQAVRLVLDEGKSVGRVARDLDLTETALREWVKRARADRTHGMTGLTTVEREELARPPERESDFAGRAGDLKAADPAPATRPRAWAYRRTPSADGSLSQVRGHQRPPSAAPLCRTPSLDVSLHEARAADETFDGVRRGERAAQAW
jgi:transposase